MRIYLDTAPVIYAIESVEPFVSVVSDWINKPDTSLIVSDLTRLECRVLPIRDNNRILLDAYDEFFDNAIESIIPLSTEIVDQATLIRARYGFGVPDSIHLAVARLSDCDVFLSNDRRLAGFKDIAVEIINTV